MPYSARKNGNKITVTKKDTGEVVGHTTPENYKGYMAALHMHESPEEHKMCGGGMVGYAKGGRVWTPEERANIDKENAAAKKNAFSEPSADAKDLADIAASGFPLAADPEAQDAGLKNEIPRGGSLLQNLHVPQKVQDAINEVGMKGAIGTIIDQLKNPGVLPATPQGLPPVNYDDLATAMGGGDAELGSMGVNAFSEGGVIPNKEKESTEIPEDVKEYIEKMHSDKNNSRPDEGWRIVPPAKADHIANYKKDDEELEDSEPNKIPMDDNYKGKPVIDEEDKVLPHYDDGGNVNQPDDSDNAPTDEGPGPNDNLSFMDNLKDATSQVIAPFQKLGNLTEQGVNAAKTGIKNAEPLIGASGIPILSDVANADMARRDLTPNVPPTPPIKDISDQGEGNNTSGAADYLASKNAGSGATGNVGKSNLTQTQKDLGLDDAQKMAAFMKLLGDKGQNAQLGAGLAGIGDAIASGGTLGKVNPGGLKQSEEMIQGKQKQGVEGYQLVQANSPYSPEIQKALVTQFHVPAALAGAPRTMIDKILPESVNIQLKNMELAQQKSIAEQNIAEARAGRQATAAGEIAKSRQGWLPNWQSPFTTEQGKVATTAETNIAKTGLPSNPGPTADDRAAYAHAKANPQDPKSAKILAILKSKGLI